MREAFRIPQALCVLFEYLYPADGPGSKRLDGRVALAPEGRVNPSYGDDFHSCVS